MNTVGGCPGGWLNPTPAWERHAVPIRDGGPLRATSLLRALDLPLNLETLAPPHPRRPVYTCGTQV